MRGPNETTSRELQKPTAFAIQAKSLPGGKVLARLQFFEQSRGLLETDIDSPQADKPILQNLLAYSEENEAEGETPTEEETAISDSPYLTAFQKKEKIVQAQPAVPIPTAWRPLGPFSIPHGQTYGSGSGSRPSVSGRISSIAVDPTNPSHFLIGAASGGVWESRDNGQTWDPRTDDQPTLAIGALAFDLNNSSVVYAGTGEGDFYRRLGVGLLISTDGGTNWHLHATGPFAGLGFYDLIVDPLDSNHLLAATSGNLSESSDGGESWTVRRQQRTWDLSMHPPNNGNANSTQEVFAGCSDGLHRSTDGGQTWNSVNLPGVPASFNRIEVCHAPSNGNIVYVFASGGGNTYLWRRDTFGGAFVAQTSPPDLNNGQDWYDWCAAVVPNDPDTIYVGAIDIHKGVRTSAGAWTWTRISARSSGDSIHPDQHHITFHPTNPDIIYIGNDGGIYRSNNGGTNWESLNKGLCISEFEYLAQHPQYDAWILSGTQDNGTMRYEGGEVWYHVADGDGGDCGINDKSPYTCFHTFFGMGMERSTSGGGWDTFSWIGPNVPNGYDSLFYPPLEVKDNVVAQAGQSVFISTNNGTSWTEATLPTGAGRASALAITTSTRILVGTTTGNVYQIDRVNGVWQNPVTLTRPRAGFVSDLLVDPSNTNRIWVTYSNITGGHVFRSDDSGSNWDDVSVGLPNIATNAIVLDPANTDTIYIGCDVGVYRSTDAGTTWNDFNNGLPNAIVGDLLFHPVYRVLRAGTRNRGVWEIPVDAATLPDVRVYLRDSSVDTGRQTPSPSGGNDPFRLGVTTKWYDCRDIKVDAAPFQWSASSEVDFERFEDDHGVFAGGLIRELTKGQTRVFVQVHNDGLTPATNVAVKVFYADAKDLPQLPENFWTNFPNNSILSSSPWKPIAQHRTVPRVEIGRPQVASFVWNVPSNTSGAVWLLPIVSAANDPIITSERDIARLVRYSPQCGLKRIQTLPYCGIQWHGNVPANSTVRWYTFDWPASWHVIWTVIPTTPRQGDPEIRYEVQVERASTELVTYWINVTNLTPVDVEIEGRYCVLSI